MLDVLPDLDQNFRQMAVAGGKPVVVIDLDHVAVAALPTGDGDGAVGGDVGRFAGVAAQVDAGVDRRTADETGPCACRTASSCRFRLRPACAAEWRAIAQRPIELRAREADAV